MSSGLHEEPRTVLVGRFEVPTYGEQGAPILLLHGQDGFVFNGPLIEQLAIDHVVYAPAHPGWSKDRPKEIRSLDDVAYHYLDLLDDMEEPVILVGASLGGWLAAEIATKCRHGIRACVLISPLGIKTTPTEERTFVDMFAVSPEILERSLYADLNKAPAMASLTHENYLALAYAQEAVVRFGWNPYMHNPALRHRLHRIGVPTAVIAGGEDNFVLDRNYFQEFAQLIGPDTYLRVVPGAGHRVEEESPVEVRAAITEFLATTAVTSYNHSVATVGAK
jgi:pimeloyl-ACP methyl ester carboxylesterase